MPADPLDESGEVRKEFAEAALARAREALEERFYRNLTSQAHISKESRDRVEQLAKDTYTFLGECTDIIERIAKGGSIEAVGEAVADLDIAVYKIARPAMFAVEWDPRNVGTTMRHFRYSLHSDMFKVPGLRQVISDAYKEREDAYRGSRNKGLER